MSVLTVSLNIKGEFYRLVKQKYQNDTLFIVCIKDQASKRIQQAVTDYAKTFTDKPIDTKHNGKANFNFVKDYLPSFYPSPDFEWLEFRACLRNNKL